MIVEIILGTLTLVLGYTTYNLFRKLEKQESDLKNVKNDHLKK